MAGNLICEINQIDPHQWDGHASSFDDYTIYQSSAYQDSRATHDKQRVLRVIVRDQDNIRLMALVRVKSIPLSGLVVGYVQSGPLVFNISVDLPMIVNCIETMTKGLFEAGINIVRISPHIINDDSGSPYRQALEQSRYHEIAYRRSYRTFLVDVSDSEEGIRSRLRKSFRRDLRYSEKEDGIDIDMGNGKEHFDIMNELYLEAKQRKGFSGRDIEEYWEPQNGLRQEDRFIVLIIREQRHPVAALLMSMAGHTAIVMLAAVRDAGLKKMASYRLWYLACIEAHKRGKSYCDLGGVDPEKNKSVYTFKSRLGGKEVVYIGTFENYKNKYAALLWKLISKALKK